MLSKASLDAGVGVRRQTAQLFPLLAAFHLLILGLMKFINLSNIGMLEIRSWVVVTVYILVFMLGST